MMISAISVCSRRLFPVVGLMVVVAIGAGCDILQLPGAPNASTASSDDPADALRGAIIEIESPNEDFAQAQSAPMRFGAEITIAGRIDPPADIDVWALGPAATGDRITIDVRGNGLNTVAALFDAAGDLIDANDDRSYYGGLVDPSIAVTLRRPASGLYLGIALTGAQRSGGVGGANRVGDYSIRVRRDAAGATPSPRRQLVYVNFEGGDLVQIALEPAERMRPFTAESISGRLSGQSTAIVDAMLEKLRQDFIGLDVVIYDSKNHDRPSEAHSVLYVGNYNPQFLGLADNVDNGNVALTQEAIIYSEDIALFEALQPTPQEVGQALGNVAAHELGHLLGLEHTGQITDLMSIAASARQMLEEDLAFQRVTLYRDVFPIGWQDNPATLLQNVGAAPTGRVRMAEPAAAPRAGTQRRIYSDVDIRIPTCNRCAELLGACTAPAN